MSRMTKRVMAALGMMLVAVPVARPAMAQAVVSAESEHFAFIDPASVAPERLLPAPPANGSPEEAIELAALRRIVVEASPARLAQARWDDAHEDPSLFDAVMGRKLADLPATWALLLAVQHETDMAVDLSKAHFKRLRPWAVDPSLPNCDAGRGKKPVGSYPSGHSGLGYAAGWVLAQLDPARAPAILARAADYARSREICGVHFPSDTEASHVVGMVVATRLFADPRLAARIAAARAELAGPK